MAHLQILPGTYSAGPHNKERYFLEIRQRYKWILDMGGERVILFKRRFTGERCPLFDQIRKRGPQHEQDTICFGTGYVSGYFRPVEIVISLISGNQEQAIIEEYGRKRIYTPTSWTLWEPRLNNGDFIVRRNNQRLWVTKVHFRRWKHFVTRQDFEIDEVERNHPVYDLKI